jgi:hypothetical protein
MSQIELKIKEKYYNLVPRPTNDERKALKESIMIHGLREPIVVNEKYEILDGHTRYEICTELGLNPKYRIEKFLTETLEISYVIEANLKRRHLTSFQKIELSYVLFLEMKKDAIERSQIGLVHHKGKIKVTNVKGRTTDNLGREIGVGRSAMQMGLYLVKFANEEIKTKLRNSSISISAAYHLLTKQEKNPHHKSYLKIDQLVKCPCCNENFRKSELIIVEEK